MIQSLSSLYPLLIKQSSWDEDVLTIVGDDWNFNTASAWRIAYGGKIQFACWDKEISDRLKELEGLSIVSLRPQGRYVQEDPVFELSDGRCLEIFSTDTVESWVFQIPDGKVYVGGY
jgi:hypothetical protein